MDQVSLNLLANKIVQTVHESKGVTDWDLINCIPDEIRNSFGEEFLSGMNLVVNFLIHEKAIDLITYKNVIKNDLILQPRFKLYPKGYFEQPPANDLDGGPSEPPKKKNVKTPPNFLLVA